MDLPVTGLAQVGPWGLVSIFVLSVFLGGLIPRWTFVKVINEKDQVIKGKDVLIEKLQVAADRRDAQFERIFQQTEVIVKLLEDLKHAGSSRMQGTG